MQKVYVNKKPVKGPWGGGNKFVRKLSDYLTSLGYKVTYNLTKDVDIIFCFDPRPNSEGLWYQHFLDHKFNYGSKIIQRVGDIGTHSKPDLTNLVKETIKLSDFIIFPSIWAKNTIGYDKQNYEIVENAPLSIFYNHAKSNNLISNKIKVVTHHWSTNIKKGYDYYEYLGGQIKEGNLPNIEFTFIGRFNHDYSSEGINLIDPMDEMQLSIELPKHDVYLTASIEEAGANHVLEALACGLPVVYRKNGGSIAEYCNGFGVEYDNVKTMVSSINNCTKSCVKYTRSMNDVIERYEKLIGNIK